MKKNTKQFIKLQIKLALGTIILLTKTLVSSIVSFIKFEAS